MNRKYYLLPAVLLSSVAFAHTGLMSTQGFWHGFFHPLGGLDHLLAMVAVGIWATHLGGRSLWLVPLTFVAVMVLGGFAGILGVTVPFVETGIIVSVFFLGALVLFAARLPLAASLAVVGLFALFHGHAHGAEIPGDAGGLGYAAGFVLATALLHVAGLAIGFAAARLAKVQTLGKFSLLRSLGVAIIAGGIWVVIG